MNRKVLGEFVKNGDGNKHDGHYGDEDLLSKCRRAVRLERKLISFLYPQSRLDCRIKNASVGRELSIGSTSDETGVEKKSSGKIDRGNSRKRVRLTVGKSSGKRFL
jgi:hypothetical protein